MPLANKLRAALWGLAATLLVACSATPPAPPVEAGPPKDKPEMTQQLADAYTRADKANGAQVIPVGLAFARSVAARPEIELYVADKRHPSLAGTYLAACTTFATLFGQSPVGLAYTAGLNADVARALQTAAGEAAQAYARS